MPSSLGDTEVIDTGGAAAVRVYELVATPSPGTGHGAVTLIPKEPGVPTLFTLKVRLVPALLLTTLLTTGIVPVPVKVGVAPLRNVPVTVTVEAEPPLVPALPAIVVICGPLSTPRPTANVTVPLSSVNVTG